MKSHNIIITLLLLSISLVSFAQTYTFTNATGDGSIYNASNWEPNKVPQSYENVVFASDVVISGDVRYSRITVNSEVNFECKGTLYTNTSDGPCFMVYGYVKVGAFNGGITKIYSDGVVNCNGNYTTPNHLVNVEGSLIIGGNLKCAPIQIEEKANVKVGGSLNTSNNKVEVKGWFTVEGDIIGAPLEVTKTGTLAVSGTIDTSNNPVVISGNAFVNNIKANPVTVKEGADVYVAGDVTTLGLTIEKNSSLSVDGDISSNNGWGNLNLAGSLELGSDSKLTSVDVILDESAGPEFIFDADANEILFRHDAVYTEERIAWLLAHGYGKSTITAVWTGAKSSDWFDKENWSNKTVPTFRTKVNLSKVASNAYYPVIDNQNETAVANVVKIASGAKLTIENGGSIEANSIYVASKNDKEAFVVNHNYAHMSSVRIANGNVLVNGTNEVYKNVVVNRTFETGVKYYIGSSTVEGSASGFVNLNDNGKSVYDDLHMYDPVDETFSDVSSFTNPVDGHAIYLDKVDGLKERTISQTGALYGANQVTFVSLRLYHEGRTDADFGWNLISNPYPYSFPLKSGVKCPGIEYTIFRHYNPATRVYEQHYYSFVADVTIPVKNGKKISEEDSYLAPQQAFYVRADRPGMSFVFNPVEIKQVPVNTSLKASKVIDDVLYLSLNNQDQTALVFRDGGTLGVNKADANKKMEKEDNNQIYLIKEDAEYAIGLYPEVAEAYDEVLPLGIMVPEGTDVATISALNLGEFDSSADVYLVDFEKNETYNLRENDEVSVAVEGGAKIENRFAVVLKSNKSLEAVGGDDEIVTAIENVDFAAMISAENGDVKVSLAGADEAMANVYDVAGRLVAKSNLASGTNVVAVGQNKGIYIVEVIAGDRMKTSKVVIR